MYISLGCLWSVKKIKRQIISCQRADVTSKLVRRYSDPPPAQSLHIGPRVRRGCRRCRLGQARRRWADPSEIAWVMAANCTHSHPPRSDLFQPNRWSSRFGRFAGDAEFKWKATRVRLQVHLHLLHHKIHQPTIFRSDEPGLILEGANFWLEPARRSQSPW